MSRLSAALALGWILLGGLTTPAEGQIRVTVDADALTAVETVAVLPLGCGDSAECRALEDSLAELVREHLGLVVIPRAEIEAAVERMGLNNPQGNLAHLLAQEVGADAFLRIQGSDRARGSETGVRAYPTGRYDHPGLTLQASLLGKVEAAALEMRTADDHTELIRGYSKGRRDFVGHVERILERAAG